VREQVGGPLLNIKDVALHSLLLGDLLLHEYVDLLPVVLADLEDKTILHYEI